MNTKTSAKPRGSLDDPVRFIKGVGPKRAALLQKRGLNTIRDCFYFLPFRYEDRRQIYKISQLAAGKQAAFMGKVVNAGSFSVGGRRKIFEIIIEDDSGIIRAKWFQFNESYMREKFKRNMNVILSGQPERDHYRGSGLHVIHPDIEVFSSNLDASLEMGRVVPVYHATEGLHPKTLRALMKNMIDHYSGLIEETLPEDLLKRHNLLSKREAIEQVHFPSNEVSLESLQKSQSPAHRRIIFEELFLVQLGLAHKRKSKSTRAKGAALKTRGETIRKFVKRLKFELTAAQKKVLSEIMNDLEQDQPMNRLLQGDVGSGKTIVALFTLLTGIDNEYQGAFMAPTEILAEQHYSNLKPDCEALGIAIDLATGAASSREKNCLLENMRNGKTQLIVGTHALIQKDVQFRKLGVAIIDEQHRFGVLQREALARKGFYPHILVMTATPIPRSLALTLYGDMDISILDELPPGRLPVGTKLFYGNRRELAYEAARQELEKGRQVYVVCPLIEESEALDLKTATEVQKYAQRLFPGHSVGLLHGRIKKEERSRIMKEFKAGALRILVATTVIEVGIDIPNASVAIIEHAERFGLSQLHQLRGRVGRGQFLSQCLLIAYYPLTEEAKARLQVMLKTNDGFLVAEEDLKIRGPGDFMGTRQSGLPELQNANLVRDIKILEAARKEAFALIDRDPHLAAPELQNLKKAFRRFMGNRLDLMGIL
ncbi:MAG: ATP-dependent DNA helicase RecG [Nitrospinales bacterium]